MEEPGELPIQMKESAGRQQDDLTFTEDDLKQNKKKDRLKLLRSPQQDMLIDEYKKQFAERKSFDDDSSLNDSSFQDDKNCMIVETHEEREAPEKIAIPRSPEHDVLLNQYKQRFGVNSEEHKAEVHTTNDEYEEAESRSGDEIISSVRTTPYSFDSEEVKETKVEYTVRGKSDSEHSDAKTSERSQESGNHHFADLQMPMILQYEEAVDERRSEGDQRSITSAERKHLNEEQNQVRSESEYLSYVSKSQAEPTRKLTSTAAQRQVAVAVRAKQIIQPTPFEPQSQYVKELFELAPKISSIKSRFEDLNRKEEPKYGYPPEIPINFGEGSSEEVKEDYLESDDDRENDQEEQQIGHTPGDDNPQNVPGFNEKQKPINEIFNLFGGKATPQEKEKALLELSRRNQLSFVDKSVMASETATEKAAESLDSSSPEVPNIPELDTRTSRRNGTEHLDESRFMSVRVVRSVRNFVRERDPVLTYEPSAITGYKKKKTEEIPNRKEVAVQTTVVRKQGPEKMQLKDKSEMEVELTVAEKRKLFESSTSLGDRMTHHLQKISRGQQTDEQQAEGFSTANERMSGNERKGLAEQIEEATQEISDYLSYLTPVSQRRSRFEKKF